MINTFKVYTLFSRFPYFKNSYKLKLFAVAVLGNLLPLMLLLTCLLITDTAANLLFYLLILITLIANAIITYLILRSVLYPISVTANALQNYIEEKQIPTLPIQFKDSPYQDTLGHLMSNVQYIIEKLESSTKSLKTASNIDPLTGILTRHFGEERLMQDMARAKRGQVKLLIAIVDIDNFKKINEQFGHNLGDVCLTHIVETLSKNIRAGDWLARWGEDEFLMVLWNVNHTHLGVILERIQQQSVKTPMGELLEISLSIGACQYDGESEIDTLIMCANKALYQAQDNGHGSIVLVELEPSSQKLNSHNTTN